jgi:DNA processing protein
MTDSCDRDEDVLWLHWVTDGEPGPFRRLSQCFGGATMVRENRRSFMSAGMSLSKRIAERLRGDDKNEETRYLERAAQWLGEPNHGFVTVSSSEYPGRLREIADPPPVLYVDGDASLLASMQLAIVGTRRATATGRRVAIQMARDVARAGLVVTSGMAIGIDTAAHLGALESEEPTIAVLGTGVDVVYPPRNVGLARRIQEAGMIVSEFPLGTPAFPANFPRRNRVVTGLSVGTLVIEAALKSGSLISARLAMEQGREAFAVPGSVLNAQSRGCHFLIRDGARLTESIEDIADELSLIIEPSGAPARVPALSPAKQCIVEAIDDNGVDIDRLVEMTGMDVASLIASLVELEIEDIVERSAMGYILLERRS